MFDYVATTNDGQLQRGVSQASSRAAAIRELEAAGLIVVSVRRARSGIGLDDLVAFLTGGVSHLDKVLFTKHLALMLKAGLTLSESLRILEDQTSSLRLKIILRRVIEHVEGGGSFSEGIGLYPRVFSLFYVNIIRAGEVSGTLENNLEHLADQFSKEYELRMKVRTALMYPTVVLVAAVAIAFFFAGYVLPQVAQLFVGLKGIKLPWVTLAMLETASFAKKYTFVTLLAFIAAVVFLVWFLRRRFLQPVTHLFVLRAPILGRIVKDVNLARFSLVLGTMLKSGIPITRAIEVTAEVLGNRYYKLAMLKALDGVQGGISLSDGLARSPKVFPKITTRMVNVGERSGKLEDVLGYLADFYQLEVDSTMRNLSNILEPVLLAVIGVVAMLLAYAIIIPIYDFIGTIARIGR